MRFYINQLLNLSRVKKQLIMVGFDLLLIPLSLLLAYALKFNNYFPVDIIYNDLWIFYFMPIIVIPLFIKNGLYRSVLKYMGYHVIIATMRSITIACLLILLYVNIFDISASVTAILTFWFVAILLTIGSRYILKLSLYYSDYNKKQVGIYGAGKTGAQLIDNLKGSSEYIPVALFDDNASKWGAVVNSIWVSSPEDMDEVIKVHNIKLILLAITTLANEERKKILRNIANYPVEVRVITSIENIISGQINFESVKKVDVLDILGREPVKPSGKLLNKNIKGKSILVTGAGGSIGSELCEQIVKLSPKQIVILDHSEFAIYKINNFLKSLTHIKVIPILTSVTESEQILSTIKKYKIDTIYHAAAYKHVPMVELNPFDGIRNNILGTHVIVKAAIECKVKTFILISTDKAVRPTNVMGATKRFSELILQAAQDESIETCFSMVRFGNVLDSAGSVVPLFREQIKLGGPVTVTSQDVTRYFMSIQEAVQLVIQAGAMAKGGDVFVLDMGEPIKIYDLAQKMIHLSGFQPITLENPNGEIEIKITGLRPGEKLFEELLIGNNVFTTDHPQIMQAREIKYSWKEMEMAIQQIVYAIKNIDLELIRTTLIDFIDGYEPSIDAFPYEASDSKYDDEYIKAIETREKSYLKGLS